MEASYTAEAETPDVAELYFGTELDVLDSITITVSASAESGTMQMTNIAASNKTAIHFFFIVKTSFVL